MEDDIKVDSSRGLMIDRHKDDYTFGASPLSKKQKVLVSDGQWAEYEPKKELQRNNLGDTYGCVPYSKDNIIEVIHKKKYGYEINIDDRDLTVGSGTVPYKGNGMKKVADWQRKNGFIKERGAFDNKMSIATYYAWKRDYEAEIEAEKSLKQYDIEYEWLPTCNFGRTYSSPEQLMEALPYSPIQACVDATYEYDENGYIGKLLNWNHCIVIIGYVKNKYWIVLDSESNHLLEFQWGYKFGYPMAHYLTKKNNMQLFKKKGSPAIYFLNPLDGKLVPYADGIITGGAMFKILFGDYSNAPIEYVDELPYEVADYSLTTK